MMKTIKFLALFIILSPITVLAQSFDDGLKAYNNGDYSSSLDIFLALDTQSAHLFSGKSLLNQNRLQEALFFFNKASKGSNITEVADALYSMALILIIQDDPTFALELLNEEQLLEGVRGSVQLDAKRLFNQYNSFLTAKQRFEVLRKSSNPFIIESIAKEGIRIEGYNDALSIYNYVTNIQFQQMISDQALEDLKQSLNSRSRNPNRTEFQSIPDGFSYSIGVTLPSQDKNSGSFVVSKSIYQGLQFAFQEYNAQNRLQNIYLSFLSIPDSTNSIADLYLNESVDLIVGPLTSQQAKIMLPQAENLQIPLIAPLANNDSLNVDNPYFFQVNPTFKSRGLQMARFALDDLNADTVAIMVDINTLGYLSALAFKNEIEINGGHVAYFFAEPFEETAFDIADYTKYFTSDSVMIDSLNIPNLDAIYLPFTGEQSATLIDLTLTDLEAGRTNATLIGSQDWAYIDISSDRLSRFTVYYPDAKIVDEENPSVIQFRQNFAERGNNQEADVFAFLGYDIGKYIVKTIESVKNPNYFKSALKFGTLYYGLANTIHFNGTHANATLTIYKLDSSGITVVK